ncbi:hypothetical protein Agub_g6999, partial [Astrephomene gubernaculifera]
MFEGWAADLLATSLGRFVDVQKDKLRISLWSGSGVLENVRLRAEAFDYLKLPFAIHEGVVGRLRIKIPWGNWLTGALVVELSDVLLCATEREDSEWEESAALRREYAAKQADLAAAELAKLSRRMVVQQNRQGHGHHPHPHHNSSSSTTGASQQQQQQQHVLQTAVSVSGSAPSGTVAAGATAGSGAAAGGAGAGAGASPAVVDNSMAGAGAVAVAGGLAAEGGHGEAHGSVAAAGAAGSSSGGGGGGGASGLCGDG